MKRTKRKVKKRIKKGAVAADAIRQNKERIGTSEWIQRSVEFDRSLRVPKDKHYIIDLLFEKVMQSKSFRKREQKILDLEILISNLTQTKRIRPITISLNRNQWKKSKYSKTSFFIIELANILKEQKLIEMKIGYKTENESRKTRIWATEKLLEYCKELPKHIISEVVEVVELRDQNGKLIEYKDKPRTLRIRAVLTRINDVNSKVDIRYYKRKINATMVAIFKESFSLYGRLHTRGYSHVQGLSGDERKELTINGRSVIELDYSGLHPNLLYASIGKQYSGDPYSVVNDNPIARPFLKQILLCLLNSDSELKVEKAARYWLNKNYEEKEALNKIGITTSKESIQELIQAFKKEHKLISQYFCAGKHTGMRIMNKDAEIAVDVIDHFGRQSIPILAIHDSFIVQEQYRDELHETMRKVYARKTDGFRINIK